MFDPSDPTTNADPFPAFRRLREHEPLHSSEVLGGYVVTRYEDVRRTLLDPAFSADRMTPFFRAQQRRGVDLSLLARTLGEWLVFKDPPSHTRLRKLAAQAFTSRALADWVPSIQATVEELVGGLAGRRELDLIGEFAYPLPARVILGLLGLTGATLEEVHAWSRDIAPFIGTAQGTPDKYVRAERGARAMAEHLDRELFDRRRRPRDDLLTALARAHAEEGKLSDDEVIATSILLLFAGHETTTNLIGNGVHHLLAHRAEWQRLVEAPEALAPTAVEEVLRFDGPSAMVVRVVAEPITLHGRTLRTGDRVFAMLSAANRDPAAFPEPDRLDVARSPNHHLAFGLGPHFCLGAPLARLEGRLAFAALARALPGLRPAAVPAWHDGLTLRGLVELRVSTGLA